IFRVQLAGETEAAHCLPVALRFIEKAAQMVLRISIARVQGDGLLHVGLKVVETLQHEGSQRQKLVRLAVLVVSNQADPREIGGPLELPCAECRSRGCASDPETAGTLALVLTPWCVCKKKHERQKQRD